MIKKGVFTIISIILILSFLLFYISCKPKEKEEKIEISREEEIGLFGKYGTPIDTILLLDQSESMKGFNNYPATDPDDLRIEASKYFINNLSQMSETEPYIRAGIINFGTNVLKENVIELSTLTSKPDDVNIEKLINSLKPLSLGYTSFIKAFKEAYNQFIKYNTLKENRKPIIIIFTDGEPDDERHLSINSYFNEIEKFHNEYLKKINCEIYIIGIDKTGKTWEKTISYWEKFLPKQNIIKIIQMEELFQKYNELIQKMFHLPTAEPDIIVKTLDFDVQPYLEKIQFDVYPETKDIVIEITDAEGNKISENNPDVLIKKFPTYTTIIVSNPISGKWKYEIVKGEGKVKIYKTLIPNKMKLVSPDSNHILGKGFYVIFAFFKSDNTEVKLLPEYPLVFNGKIISPTGDVTTIKFNQGENGIYRSENLYDPEKDGKYKIILTATGREGFEIKDEFEINVVKLPYIIVNYPSKNSIINGFKRNLNVEVLLLYEKKPINSKEYFSTNPNSLIWVQLVYLPDGSKSKYVIPLTPSSIDIGKFNGVIPTSLNIKGQYILKAELNGKLLSNGELFKDIDTVNFIIKPTIIDYLLIYKYIILAIIILSLLFFYVRNSMKPRLEGYIEVDGEDYPLKGNKVTLGGKGSDITIDPNIKGVYAYLVAKLEKYEDSVEKIIELHSKSDEKDKNFENQEILGNNSTFKVKDKIIRYKKISGG